MVILILLFGEKKLPKLARDLGHALSEFQRGRMEVEKELNDMRKGLNLDIKPTTYRANKIEPLIQSTKPSGVGNEIAGEIEESEKLTKVARALGISVEGKTNEQLKEEVKKALEIG